MLRVFLIVSLSFLFVKKSSGFEEAAIAGADLPAIISQLETGDWNARIHAVHELEYMQSAGLPGLGLATEDGDWQVRMTAVQALGPHGDSGAPILKKLLRHEPCPVVRLLTLHNLGTVVTYEEEAGVMNWISNASAHEINACQDQPGPGRAPWVRGKPAAETDKPVRRAETPPLGATVRPPKKFNSNFDVPSATVSRRGVVLQMLGRSTATPEHLPWPVALTPREHDRLSPNPIFEAGGGKTPHDALPDLLRALKQGDVRTRARAADDLGHLGATAEPAVPALMAALTDDSGRVRASAALALGNIGASHTRIVPLLTDALQDPNEDVRYAAALGLSRLRLTLGARLPLTQ